MPDHHLAQLNIARLLGPLDSPQMADFVANLDRINALADCSRGYRSAHIEIMRRRREWFGHLREAYMVLWWIPQGHAPSIEEAAERLARLRQHGPTGEAFTFKKPFPAPGYDVVMPARQLDGFCPAG